MWRSSPRPRLLRGRPRNNPGFWISNCLAIELAVAYIRLALVTTAEQVLDSIGASHARPDRDVADVCCRLSPQQHCRRSIYDVLHVRRGALDIRRICLLGAGSVGGGVNDNLVGREGIGEWERGRGGEWETGMELVSNWIGHSGAAVS